MVSFERETRKWSGWKELAGILGIRETAKSEQEPELASFVKKNAKLSYFRGLNQK